MPVRWDPLLARHTAAELDAALRGARLAALRLDGTSLELALLLADHTLVWRLHPRHGWPLLEEPHAPREGDLRLGGRVLGVSAPPDERLVLFEISGGKSRPAHTLVVELVANLWNVIVVEGASGVVRHVLRRGGGRRERRVGSVYAPPPPRHRTGVEGDITLEEWLALLAGLSDVKRPAELVSRVAWTSPLNAAALLGAPEREGEAPDLGVGWERWRRMVASADAPEPVLLELPEGLHPYPFPLAGTPHRPVGSLLEAFAEVARSTPDATASVTTASVAPTLLRRLETATHRAERRVAKLRDELASAESPELLRAIGDVILARYTQIPKGASRAQLEGFDGDMWEVELDPTAAAHANAARYYERAAKAERAAERLPDLIEEAMRAHARLEALLARTRAGEASEEEVLEALGPAAARAAPGEPEGPALPYKVFTSSGGLEIRVGRGARHNDELTFHHSAPGDVWLHARHSAGAHVILRWPGPGKPPARDLEEAATLAALHSKARTSGSAPVDWTLRKYVRKPRGSPPGRVVAERIETIFVEPDPELMERLARNVREAC